MLTKYNMRNQDHLLYYEYTPIFWTKDARNLYFSQLTYDYKATIGPVIKLWENCIFVDGNANFFLNTINYSAGRANAERISVSTLAFRLHIYY